MKGVGTCVGSDQAGVLARTRPVVIGPHRACGILSPHHRRREMTGLRGVRWEEQDVGLETADSRMALLRVSEGLVSRAKGSSAPRSGSKLLRGRQCSHWRQVELARAQTGGGNNSVPSLTGFAADDADHFLGHLIRPGCWSPAVEVAREGEGREMRRGWQWSGIL